MPTFLCSQGHDSERLHSKLQHSDGINIPNAAIDDAAFPAIPECRGRDHIAQQGASHGAASVHDQYLSLPRLAGVLFYQGVILVTFYGHDLTTKTDLAAVIGKQWFHNTDNVWMSVTQICRQELHTRLRCPFNHNHFPVRGAVPDTLGLTVLFRVIPRLGLGHALEFEHNHPVGFPIALQIFGFSPPDDELPAVGFKRLPERV